ncbi:MAG TPA: DoxX family protein [Stellaceae bacterium]|nr:DoxX family protein [Stellaceae bacterium]
MAKTDPDKRSLIIPALGGIYEALGPIAYPFVRVGAGAILMEHGYVKLFLGGAAFIADKILPNLGFYPPLTWAYFLGVLELVGGAMIVAGLLTRLIAFVLVIEFLIITFGWNFRFGFAFTNPGGGYEYPLLWLIVFVSIAIRGAGRHSIDEWIGKEF